MGRNRKGGCHDQWATPVGLRFARAANIVKAVGNPTALRVRRQPSVGIWRGVSDNGFQNRCLENGDFEAFGQACLGPLDGLGKGDSSFFVEGPNEPGRLAANGRLYFFLLGLRNWLTPRGYQLSGPCWASGDYDEADIQVLRTLKLPLWNVHAYWSQQYGPTEWNGYRWRKWWREGDPPLVVSECGIDQVRDGPNGTMVPADKADGAYGWDRQGITHEKMLQMCLDYAAGLDRPYEMGCTFFTSSPSPEWAQKGFSMDSFSDDLVWSMESWDATEVLKVATDFPGAEWIGSPNHYDGRRGQKPLAWVLHIADGTYDGMISWFRNPASEVSSTYGVALDGRVAQFVREGDAPWTNGVDFSRGFDAYKSDLSVPWIKQCWDNGINPNFVSLTIEAEGRPGMPMPDAQYRALVGIIKARSGPNGIRLAPDGMMIAGHNQIDRITRPNCPSYLTGMKSRLLKDLGAVAPVVVAPTAHTNDWYEANVWGPMYQITTRLWNTKVPADATAANNIHEQMAANKVFHQAQRLGARLDLKGSDELWAPTEPSKAEEVETGTPTKIERRARK